MKPIIFLCLIVCIITFSGCSGNKTDTKTQQGVAPYDNGILADKNFAFKNITNTQFERNLNYGDDGKLYSDKSHKIVFVELSKAQKVKLLSASIKKEIGVNSDYVRDMMTAFFIAKQPKLGDLQPIIVQVGGDDYGALKMILLDKNNAVVNAFNITGGMQGGPSAVGDSMTEYEEKNYSTINGNRVTNTRIIVFDFTDSLKKPSYVDSEVYKIEFNRSGKISIKKTIRAEYRRPFKY